MFSNIYADTLLWPESGVTVPVNDYLDDWRLGNGYFLESALDNYTNASGQIIAFPLEGFYWPVWYNTKAFDAAGVDIPQTQEDLIAAAPKLREAGYQPFVTGGSDWTGFNAFLLMLQGSIPTEEALDLATNGGWAASENALKGAELFVQMRDGRRLCRQYRRSGICKHERSFLHRRIRHDAWWFLELCGITRRDVGFRCCCRLPNCSRFSA